MNLLILYSFCLFLMIITISQVIFIGMGNDLYLPWPGRQVIPAILYLRGELGADFYASSSIHSPYCITAYIMSFLLPKNWNGFIATYGVGSMWLSILVYFSALVVTIQGWRLICKNYLSDITINRLTPYVSLLLTFMLLLDAINLKKLISVLNLSDKIIFIKAFLPRAIAVWPFPLQDAFNPSGLSLLVTLIAMIGTFNSSNSKMKWFFVSLFVVVATIFHPVIPVLLILTGVILFIAKKDLQSLKKLTIIAVIWLAAAAFVYVNFPQKTILASEYFNIYVKDRHPHHYLPSVYLKDSFLLIVFNGTLLGMLATCAYLKTKNTKVYYLITAWLFSIIIIHGVQYITVECYKLYPFITFGVSRMGSVTSFLYYLGILFYLSILFDSKTDALNYFCKRIFSKLTCLLSLQKYAYIALFLSILLYGLTISTNLYRLQFQLSQKQPVLKLKYQLESLGLSNLPVVNLSGLPYLRELGLMAVYSDEYFPFSTAYINGWYARKNLQQTLQQCLKDSRLLQKCTTGLPQTPNAVLVTDQTFNDTNSIGLLKLDKAKPVYIYKLNQTL